MTLKEWIEKSNKQVFPTPEGYYVPGANYLPQNLYTELWQLSDYIVTSVSGGTVWLLRTK